MPKRTILPSKLPPLSYQLVELIRRSGMTPAAIAAAAGVTPSILSRFLTGKRTITVETADAIAAALGGLRLVEDSRRGRPAPRPSPEGGPAGSANGPPTTARATPGGGSDFVGG